MPVYLDNNATTAMPAEVLETMLPYMQLPVGNPSSVHRFGRMSRDAIEQARVQVAALLNAEPTQVVFTSGGTEANNMAIKGACYQLGQGRLAISRIEHPSLIESAQQLIRQNKNWQLDWIEVDTQGRVGNSELIAAMNDQTRLVSIMAANNETGVIQDIESLAAIVAETGNTWFHSDVSQAAGKIALDFKNSALKLMTLSSHKLYGPRGVGALIIDSSIEIEPLIVGGGQEKNRRSGTENIAAIAGFGKAAELAKQNLQPRHDLLIGLRRQLEQGLKTLTGVTIFAEQAERLPNTTLFAVSGIEGDALLMQLDKKGYAVSSGSACHSSKTEASHVLKAMNVDDALGAGAVRVSVGIQNTPAEIEGFLQALKDVLETLQLV